MESAVTVDSGAPAPSVLFSRAKNPSPAQSAHRLYLTKTSGDGKARRLLAESKIAESERIIETNRQNKVASKASDDADIERFNQEILLIFNEVNKNVENKNINNNTGNSVDNSFNNEMSAYTIHQNEFEPSSNSVNNESRSGAPGYLRQTFASALPPYTNQDEVTRIGNCFRTGSNRSVRSLPAQFCPGAVQSAMRVNTTQNLLPKLNAPSAVSKSVKRDMKTKDGYFHSLKYTGDEYNKEAVISYMKEECDKVFTESFCRKPFKTSSRFVTPKAEDIFGGAGGRSSYPPSILGPSTGSADFTKITRSECMDSSKFLSGPFRIFTGKEREKDRKLAAQWTHQIFKLVLADWGQMKFKVKFTPEDELLVQFILSDNSVRSSGDSAPAPLPPEQAISKYMNHLASHGIAADFGFKKRGDRWGVVEVGSISAQPSKASNTLKKGAAARAKDPEDRRPHEMTDPTAEGEDVSKVMLTFSLLAPWAKNGIAFSKEYYAAQSRNRALARLAAERALHAVDTGADALSADDSSMKTSESEDASTFVGLGVRLY